MAKVPARLRSVTYSLSPMRTGVMHGLFKDWAVGHGEARQGERGRRGRVLRAAARRDGVVRRRDDGDARASDDAIDAPRDDAGDDAREDARWRGVRRARDRRVEA